MLFLVITYACFKVILVDMLLDVLDNMLLDVLANMLLDVLLSSYIADLLLVPDWFFVVCQLVRW